MKLSYKHTVYACFIGYIVQAIINNFVPLLFLTFQLEFGISLDKIAMLTGMNFGIQLLVDLLAAKFVDRIGYRPCILFAHVFSAAGLLGLTVLPSVISSPYVGICISIVIYAIGGGLLEVLVSPIVEACPGEEKEKAMSLLHSFYCWGHVGVVLLSTLFFRLAGIANWRYMAVIWALIPLANIALFAVVPIASLIEDGEEGCSIRQLFQKRTFWVFMLVMACAGACEQAVSQWASAYAESGLQVSKTTGDLAGPLLFAVTMGGARLFYGKHGERIELKKFMKFSGGLCLCSYLIIGLTKIPLVGFLGCALCGMSVGILWPGTFSLAAKAMPKGGTAMFAFFALAGDLGCAGGPTYVGMMAERLGGSLNLGILAAVVFPVVLLAGLRLTDWQNKKKAGESLQL
ncbi:MAG: MFS transporter [Lachnospiraceae bacterium]|nr:MFS transporter [Lachnospiraceae bacterium]